MPKQMPETAPHMRRTNTTARRMTDRRSRLGRRVGTLVGTGIVTASLLVFPVGCGSDFGRVGGRTSVPPAPSVSGSGLGADVDPIGAVGSDVRATPRLVTPDSGSSISRSAPGASPTTRAAASDSASEAATPGSVRLPWEFGASPGQIVVTEHYLLHTTMTNERMLTQLAMLMEEAITHYTSALGTLPWPEERMRSFIFERRSEWADHTRERLGAAAGPYLGLGRGGYTTESESVLFNIGREDTFTIAVHEGWHQYTQLVFREQLPVWLEEGIATFMEGNRFRRNAERPVFLPWRNFERYGELRDAARTGRLIPFDELIEGSPQRFLSQGRSSLLTYYAQVWAVVHFLNEGEGGIYRPALLQIIDDAAHGRMVRRLTDSEVLPRGVARRLVGQGRHGRLLIEEYVMREHQIDLATLTLQYESFVRELVSSGSASRIWRGQSPIDSAE